MAKHHCAICNAEIGLISTIKLADGNYICRKTCAKRALKAFDFMHENLYSLNAHIADVDKGTKLWNHYFVPRLKTKDKEKKLRRFGAPFYVSEELGLIALKQDDYKFFIFGKSTRACIYRIADLASYDLETENKKNSDGKTTTEHYCHFVFDHVDGMSHFRVEISNSKEFEAIEKYFDTLFGIQKTLGNAISRSKQQIDAIKSVAGGIKAVMSGDADAQAKAKSAAKTVDDYMRGDRTKWIERADAALNAFKG